MVVTLHYIDDSWEIKSVMVGFIHVMYLHLAGQLAQHLIMAIIGMDSRLLSRFWSITTDSANINPAVIDSPDKFILAEVIKEYILDMVFGKVLAIALVHQNIKIGNSNHVFLIRCTTYVFQFIIKHGLNEYSIIKIAISNFEILFQNLIVRFVGIVLER